MEFPRMQQKPMKTDQDTAAGWWKERRLLEKKIVKEVPSEKLSADSTGTELSTCVQTFRYFLSETIITS